MVDYGQIVYEFINRRSFDINYFFAVAEEYELCMQIEQNYNEIYKRHYSILLCKDDLWKRIKEVEAAEIEKLKCSFRFSDWDSD